MVIQKMNNVLVKHSKVLFGFITAVIIVSFVWFFTPGVDGSVLFGGNSSPTYGRVFDKDVTYRDLQNSLVDYKLVLSGILNAEPGRFQNIEEANIFLLMAAPVKVAEHFNIQTSDKEVVEFISLIPHFRKDNKFSQEYYNNFAETKLKKSGYSKGDFEKAIRNFLTVAKLGIYDIQLLANYYGFNTDPGLFFFMYNLDNEEVHATEDEIATFAVTLFENYKARTISFKTADFIDKVNVTEEAIRNFYDKNPSLFMTEPVSDSVVAIAKYADMPSEKVPQETIDALYKVEMEKNAKAYEGKSEKEVKEKLASDLEATIKSAEARAKIDALAKEIDTLSRGEEFKADPAKVFETAAANAGLTIEYIKGFTRKSLDPVAVESDAAVKKFDNDRLFLGYTAMLNAPGDISKVIPAKDGMGIVLLTRRTESVKMDYALAAKEAENLYKREAALKLAEEAARELAAKAANPENASVSIEELVKTSNGTIGEVVEFNLFDANQDDQRFNTVRMLAANTENGKLSKPLPYGSEVMVVFVEDRIAPSQEKIAEQKENVRGAYLNQKRALKKQAFVDMVQENIMVMRRPGDDNE